MLLENVFEVPASPDRVWELLLDVPRVVPCMPGAELTETVDDSHWKAKLQVKLGPVGLNFTADVERTEVDEAARRVVLAATARELRGRGGARATIRSSVAPEGDGSSVRVATELTLSGPAAQFGGPVVKDVAAQLTREFAACLRRQLDEVRQAHGAGDEPGSSTSPDRSEPPAAKPISALALLLRAVLARFRRAV
jgi:carbon monoxide dehydrogenase subunit G